MDDDEYELGIWQYISTCRAAVCAIFVPGTMTNSFFFVRNRSSLTSSSLSSSSTRLPAAVKKDHTELATSSALCIPLSFLPFV